MIRAACGELRTHFDRLNDNFRTHQSINMNPVLTITTADTHNLTRRRQTGKRARSGVTTLEIGQVTRLPSRGDLRGLRTRGRLRCCSQVVFAPTVMLINVHEFAFVDLLHRAEKLDRLDKLDQKFI
jgi:hypothetical protein